MRWKKPRQSALPTGYDPDYEWALTHEVRRYWPHRHRSPWVRETLREAIAALRYRRRRNGLALEWAVERSIYRHARRHAQIPPAAPAPR